MKRSKSNSTVSSKVQVIEGNNLNRKIENFERFYEIFKNIHTYYFFIVNFVFLLILFE